MRLLQPNGEIMLLDEVLTMSARMAAATGHPRWQQRYDQFDPILGAKIEAAIALAPEAYGQGAAAETEVANKSPVAMERRAFAMVERGDLLPATRLFFSSEYERQKKIYASGMAQRRLVAEQRIAGMLAAFHRGAVVALSVGLTVLVLLGGCWALIGRLILRHLRARTTAEAALHAANASLEGKVAARTAEVGESLARLRSTQDELVAASRRAGMADVASAVLHNVGNVLNSVNVSSTCAAELVRGSMVLGLAKASRMIDEHAGDLAAFMTSDARGKHLPQYLRAVSDHLQESSRRCSRSSSHCSTT